MNSLSSSKQCRFSSTPIHSLPAHHGILIMDACPVTAYGIQCTLNESCGINTPIHHVQSLAGIPAKIASTNPSMLIMEICGEKESVLDGLRLLAHLRASCPELKIVICTHFSDFRILELLASSDAHGIMLKNEPVLAMVQCVSEVMTTTGQWLSPKAKQLLSNSTPKNTTLTARELDVLAYLFSGLSVSRVAQTLHRDVRTVSTHKRNAMAKLGFHNDSELFAQGTWMARNGPYTGL